MGFEITWVTVLLLCVLFGLIYWFWVRHWVAKKLSGQLLKVRDLQIRQMKKYIKDLNISKEELFDD